MRRTAILVAILVAAVGVGAFAQAFTVSYLDGNVELQTAKGWSALNIGDQVAATATVRISQQGSLELTRARTKLTLLKDGVFSIAGLSKASSASGDGVGNSITQKLQTLVTEKPKSSTAGGVRGAQQGTSDVTWVDEGDETRAQAQSLIDSRKYADAVKMLNDAIKTAGTDTDTTELSYLLGVAYYGGGQTAKAYRTLGNINPDPGAVWYARYVILKAQVLVDTQNYSDALAILTPFISTYPTGAATQVAWLLSGISQKGLGNPDAAKSAFDSGYQMDPASDTAKLIDQQRRM